MAWHGVGGPRDAHAPHTKQWASDQILTQSERERKRWGGGVTYGHLMCFSLVDWDWASLRQRFTITCFFLLFLFLL